MDVADVCDMAHAMKYDLHAMKYTIVPLAMPTESFVLI